MTPEKAHELVTKYGQLQRKIYELTKAIGDSLNECQDINKKDTHLKDWYTPLYDEYDNPYENDNPHYKINLDECPYCAQAHSLIQLRKQARKEFGYVKGAMTRNKEDKHGTKTSR